MDSSIPSHTHYTGSIITTLLMQMYFRIHSFLYLFLPCLSFLTRLSRGKGVGEKRKVGRGLLICLNKAAAVQKLDEKYLQVQKVEREEAKMEESATL